MRDELLIHAAMGTWMSPLQRDFQTNSPKSTGRASGSVALKCSNKEYLVTENQILRGKIEGRLPFTDDER